MKFLKCYKEIWFSVGLGVLAWVVDAVMHVEHQFTDLGEAPQAAGGDMAPIELVDLAVVEESDLVEKLGHGVIIERPDHPLRRR